MPDLSMMCNGMLAGLVAITAPCAFVAAPVAIFIGAVAGVLVVLSTLAVEQSLGIDDPVGAVSVHGVNGAWGVLALGLFADGRYGEGFNGVAGPVRGLFYGDAGQLVASCLGIIVNVLWVGLVSMLTLALLDKLVKNRVSKEDEIDGLDLAEMGAPGYADEDASAFAPPVASSSRDFFRTTRSTS
jgi:Amt family ammonium transporter